MVLNGFCFFKQKTAYEIRISDWSSDVCSSDLIRKDQIDRVLGQFVHGGDAVALNYHIQRQGVSSHWTPVKQQKSTLNHPESQGNPRVAPVDRPVDRAVEGFIAPTTTGRVPGTGRDSTACGVARKTQSSAA